MISIAAAKGAWLSDRSNQGRHEHKLHAICDCQGRPLDLLVAVDRVGNDISALLSSLLNVEWMLGDRSYDADWLREALEDIGIQVCVPDRKQREITSKYDKRQCKQRNRIKIILGSLEDYRRVATRYNRCPEILFSAMALAATVIFWL